MSEPEPRWTAFTDGELRAMFDALRTVPGEDAARLRAEIDAEVYEHRDGFDASSESRRRDGEA